MTLIERVAAIDLLRKFLPDASFERRTQRRHGLVYQFVLADGHGRRRRPRGPNRLVGKDRPQGRRFDFMIAVWGDAEAAAAAFQEQKNQAVKSPAPTPEAFAVGDDSAYWAPAGKHGGSLLFRRENVVVYLRGRLAPTEYSTLGTGLDRALRDAERPEVTPGVPRPPTFVVQLPAGIRSVAAARSRGIRIPLAVPPALTGAVEFHAPDFRRTRIDRRPAPALMFYPIVPGRQSLEVVAYVTDTNTIATQKVSVDVPSDGHGPP